MLKKLWIVSICSVLMACATASEQKYEMMLNTWLNKSEVALVSHWGAPDRTYQLEGKKFLSYYTQHTTYINQPIYNDNPFWSSWPDDMDSRLEAVPTMCKTTFIIESERVVKWSHTGEGCITD